MMSDEVRLLHVAAVHLGVRVSDLISDGRWPAVLWARHETAYGLRQATPLSLPQIGRLLGGRDHSTMRNSLHRVGQRMAEEPIYRAHIASLISALKAERPPEPAPRRPSALDAQAPLILQIVRAILGDDQLTDTEARRAARSVIDARDGEAGPDPLRKEATDG